MSELHPSQVHMYLKMQWNAKTASWLCFTSALLMFFAAVADKQKTLKPALLIGATVSVLGGKKLRENEKQLNKVLGEIEQTSALNFRQFASEATKPSAQLTVTVPALEAGWMPENLIIDPIAYIQQKQKHVALVGGTGDGKSTFTQYLASKIGGRVRVYDSDAAPSEWAWLDGQDVVGRKGNFKAINEAMADDLKQLAVLVQLRGELGNDAIIGQERFTIAEEFPILADECDQAPVWIKRFAKRGRRYQQFICAIAQNDTAENFALEGDKDTLYSCFVLVRLGQFAHYHAKTKLKDERLEQWLKAGGKKRLMLDDLPCELDLSSWGSGATVVKKIEVDTTNQPQPDTTALNEYEAFILNWGKDNPGKVLKARILSQSSRLFEPMTPDEIRIIMASLADKGFGEMVDSGARLGWVWVG